MAAAASKTIAFAVAGPVARRDVGVLCDTVAAVLRATGAAVAVCDVSDAGADAVTVDAIARLQLAARRHGCRLRLCGASRDLIELFALIGLSDVLAAAMNRGAAGGGRAGTTPRYRGRT